MRRQSLQEEFQRWPALKHVLHECSGCHAVGLKPGILDTKYGDYGLRNSIKGRYEELHIGPSGLCERCAKSEGAGDE